MCCSEKGIYLLLCYAEAVCELIKHIFLFLMVFMFGRLEALVTLLLVYPGLFRI